MFGFGFGGPMGGLNGDPDCPDEEQYYDEEPNYDFKYYDRYDKKEFIKDKWYYHHKVDVTIVHQTELAYLLKDSCGKYWIPKALIHFGKKHTRQYSKFDVEYLSKN